MDASLQFNIRKCEDFIPRAKFHTLKTASQMWAMRPVCEDFQDFAEMSQNMNNQVMKPVQEDDVISFFKRHNRDHYRWSRGSENHFILPRLKSATFSTPKHCFITYLFTQSCTVFDMVIFVLFFSALSLSLYIVFIYQFPTWDR